MRVVYKDYINDRMFIRTFILNDAVASFTVEEEFVFICFKNKQKLKIFNSTILILEY
jgi:hypothetical protein